MSRGLFSCCQTLSQHSRDKLSIWGRHERRNQSWAQQSPLCHPSLSILVTSHQTGSCHPIIVLNTLKLPFNLSLTCLQHNNPHHRLMITLNVPLCALVSGRVGEKYFWHQSSKFSTREFFHQIWNWNDDCLSQSVHILMSRGQVVKKT